MSDWRAYFGPEYELWKQGDPFIAELITADDLIDDHAFNYEWLGMSEAEGQASAARLAQLRLSYELETLYRWWSL